MKTDEDLELREEFARLRREELATLPPFARTIAAARAKVGDRARPRRWAFAIAAPLAAAAALALWLVASPETPQTAGPTEVALGGTLESWDTPTDYLLDAPGTDLLDSLLDLDETDLYEVELTTDPEPRADSPESGIRRYA
jgi:hypothetical protein